MALKDDIATFLKTDTAIGKINFKFMRSTSPGWSAAAGSASS